MLSSVQFRPIPDTPTATIDLSLVVPPSVTWRAIERVIRDSSGRGKTVSVDVTDEYRGPDLPRGYRALGARSVLQHPERTLKRREIEGVRHAALDALRSGLGVLLRGRT